MKRKSLVLSGMIILVVYMCMGLFSLGVNAEEIMPEVTTTETQQENVKETKVLEEEPIPIEPQEVLNEEPTPVEQQDVLNTTEAQGLNETVASPKLKGISYQVNAEKTGWSNWSADGETAGVEGKALKLKNIRIKMKDDTLGIRYRSHVGNVGWEEDWVANGGSSGDLNKGNQIEAIQVELTGEEAKSYTVYYQVYLRNMGWTNWTKDGAIAGSSGMNQSLEALRIQVLPKDQAAPEPTGNAQYEKPTLTYATHIEDIGWQKAVSGGNKSGTEGKAKRLEAIVVNLDNGGRYDLGLRYQVHVEDYGWQNFVESGAVAGTSGESKRLEAIRIELTGEDANKFDLYYQVHAENFGDLGWASNGDAAGTAGCLKRLEQIKIVIKAKGEAAPGSLENAYIEKPVLSYASHVENIGWQNAVSEGLPSGTEGQSKRLEAMRIDCKSVDDIAVKYQVHVENDGWQSAVNSGKVAGTSGQSKRLEAIRIELTGKNADQFNIFYQVHAQDFGDLGWASNGNPAGTEGYSKRLERIRIVIKPKGDPAPGPTDRTFYNQREFPNTHKNTGNRRSDIINVAMSQVGYEEGVDGFSKYGLWYEQFKNNDPSYRTEEWCAIFISWCAEQANVQRNIVPLHDWCYEGYGFFQKIGRFRYGRSGYVPQSGDIIYFNWGHTALVTGCDGKNVYTVEGNTGGSSGKREGVYLKSHPLNASYIYGFGIPNY